MAYLLNVLVENSKKHQQMKGTTIEHSLQCSSVMGIYFRKYLWGRIRNRKLLQGGRLMRDLRYYAL